MCKISPTNFEMFPDALIVRFRQRMSLVEFNGIPSVIFTIQKTHRQYVPRKFKNVPFR